MKKSLLLFAFSIPLFLISCKSESKKNDDKNTTGSEDSTASRLVADDAFSDTLNGKQVSIFYLRNEGIEAAVTNFGGRLVNLIVPDSSGKMVDVVIGPGNYKDMLETKDYFGATIGRWQSYCEWPVYIGRCNL